MTLIDYAMVAASGACFATGLAVVLWPKKSRIEDIVREEPPLYTAHQVNKPLTRADEVAAIKISELPPTLPAHDAPSNDSALSQAVHAPVSGAMRSQEAYSYGSAPWGQQGAQFGGAQMGQQSSQEQLRQAKETLRSGNYYDHLLEFNIRIERAKRNKKAWKPIAAERDAFVAQWAQERAAQS